MSTELTRKDNRFEGNFDDSGSFVGEILIPSVIKDKEMMVPLHLHGAEDSQASFVVRGCYHLDDRKAHIILTGPMGYKYKMTVESKMIKLKTKGVTKPVNRVDSHAPHNHRERIEIPLSNFQISDEAAIEVTDKKSKMMTAFRTSIVPLKCYRLKLTVKVRKCKSETCVDKEEEVSSWPSTEQGENI